MSLYHIVVSSTLKDIIKNYDPDKEETISWRDAKDTCY